MNLERLDLNLLRVFEALWLEGSVTRAAQRLYLAQPSVSNALNRLRATLGDELFVRGADGMEPTPLARAMAPALLAHLQGLRGVLQWAQPFEPQRAQRVFTLATGDYVEALLFAQLMARLRQQAPGINVRLEPLDKERYAGDLLRGRLDLVLGVFADLPEQLACRRLFTDRFVLVARRGHPALQGELTPAAYAGLDHVLMTLRRDAVGVIDRALAERGLQRRVVATVANFLTVLEGLAETDLVINMPERLAQRVVGCYDLGVRELPLTMDSWSVHMVWRQHSGDDPALEWLRQLISRALGDGDASS